MNTYKIGSAAIITLFPVDEPISTDCKFYSIKFTSPDYQLGKSGSALEKSIAALAYLYAKTNAAILPSQIADFLPDYRGTISCEGNVRKNLERAKKKHYIWNELIKHPISSDNKEGNGFIICSFEEIKNINLNEEVPENTNTVNETLFQNSSVESYKTTVFDIIDAISDKTSEEMITYCHNHEIPTLKIGLANHEQNALFTTSNDRQTIIINESYVPLCANPFIVPKDISLEKYKSNLISAFDVAFSLPAPMQDLFAKAISETYMQYGWNETNSSFDKDIELFDISDVIKSYLHIVDESSYGINIKKNLMFGGIFKHQKLFEKRVHASDITHLPSTEDILTKSTVIDTSKLGPVQRYSFCMLALIGIYAYLKTTRTRSFSPQNIIILDDFHFLTETNDVSKKELKALDDVLSQLIKHITINLYVYGIGIIISNKLAFKNDYSSHNTGIIDNTHANKYHFRKNEIDEIKQELLSDRHSCIAITADGGIGKSTIARELLFDVQIKNHYDDIIWVDYVGNLDDSILNAVDFFSDISDKTIRLKKIKEFLSRTDSLTLLIIDNVIVDTSINQDPVHETGAFSPLNISCLSAHIDVIITTRISTLPNNEYIIKRIDDFQDNVNLGTQLFMYHYNSLEHTKLSGSDISHIERIVSFCNGNPFVIMLFAKQAATTSVEEVFLYLEESLSKTQNQYMSTEQLINSAITYKDVSEEEQRILLEFAILPNIHITESECSKWFSYNLSCVSHLSSEGWLELETSDDNCYKMHDLVKNAIKTSVIGLVKADLLLDENHFRYEDYRISYEYTIREGLVPPSENSYGEILKSLDNNSIVMFDHSNYSQVTRFAEILKTALQYCALTNDQRAKMSHLIATLSFKYIKNNTLTYNCYNHALSCLRYSIEYANNRDEEIHSQLLMSSYHFDFGYFLSSLDNKRYDEAADELRKAKDYLNRTYSKFIIDTDYVYNRIALAIDFALLENDISCLNTQLIEDILQESGSNKTEEFIRNYATILDHWGYILTISNNNRFDEAEIFLRIAYELEVILYKSNPEKEIQLMSRIEDNLGYLLFHISSEYHSGAKHYLNSALDMRRKLLRKNRYAHLSEYSWTLNNLAELQTCIGGKELECAEKNYKKAIKLRAELNDLNHGKYQHYLAWSNYGLGRCLARQGREDEAKECFDYSLQIYKTLSNEVEAFKRDYEFVLNVDIDLEDEFRPWIGNHSHFNGCT